MNNRENIILMKIMLPYSLKKITAKIEEPYSTLNPDTSSDSPSAKSNGVRFVSATQQISHIPIIGGYNIIFDHLELLFTKSSNLMVFLNNK